MALFPVSFSKDVALKEIVVGYLNTDSKRLLHEHMVEPEYSSRCQHLESETIRQVCKRTANPGAGQLREAAQRAGVRSATRESFWFPRPGRMPAR